MPWNAYIVEKLKGYVRHNIFDPSGAETGYTRKYSSETPQVPSSSATKLLNTQGKWVLRSRKDTNSYLNSLWISIKILVAIAETRKMFINSNTPIQLVHIIQFLAVQGFLSWE